MGNKAGKIWGQTELIEANGSCEFHRIDFVKGGTCSKHKHEYKWNGFYVMSGEMKIRVWQKDYDLIDETILKAGDYTAVKPGLYHSFEGLEDGVAFELYWAEFRHNDIQRESVGHLKSSNVVRLDKKNDRSRIKIARKGKKKYFKLFNEFKIAKYIVEKSLGKKVSLI